MGSRIRTKDYTLSHRDNGTVYERRKIFGVSYAHTYTKDELALREKKYGSRSGLYYWLCYFGGFLGLHRYAVGDYWLGVLYTATFGLLCIGWIVDLVKICRGTFHDRIGVIVPAPKLTPVIKASWAVMVLFFAGCAALVR